jgi:hypothetical protein
MRSSSKKLLLRVAVAGLLATLVMGLVLVLRIWLSSRDWPWPSWTGFGEETGAAKGTVVKVVQYRRTLWDWLDLLLVPLAIAVVAPLLTWVQQQREEDRDTRREQDSVLDTYLAQIGSLILHEGLGEPSNNEGLIGPGPISLRVKPDSAARHAQHVAQAQTSTALRRLDSERTELMLRFLSQSNLLLWLDLSRASLSGATLNWAKLSGTNLEGADLRRTNLGGVDLRGANLRGANLKGADLRQANLRGADLSGGTTLSGADLSGANLHSADLSRASLAWSTMNWADLRGAHLYGAYLQGADLREVKLQGADLYGANLRWAKNTTGEQAIRSSDPHRCHHA